jgi:hypothetical protein
VKDGRRKGEMGEVEVRWRCGGVEVEEGRREEGRRREGGRRKEDNSKGAGGGGKAEAGLRVSQTTSSFTESRSP